VKPPPVFVFPSPFFDPEGFQQSQKIWKILVQNQDHGIQVGGNTYPRNIGDKECSCGSGNLVEEIDRGKYQGNKDQDCDQA
jgi:hypothetical protein